MGAKWTRQQAINKTVMSSPGSVEGKNIIDCGVGAKPGCNVPSVVVGKNS